MGMLEQQLAMRVSADYLKEIGVLEPYKKHIDYSSIQDDDIQNKANLILKSLLAPKKNSKIAPALASTAKKLQMEKSKNALKHKLNEQMSKSEAMNIAHIDDTISPRLVSTKKKLENAQKADIVSNTLKNRSSAGLDCKISPAIQSIAASLHSQRRRDSLKKQMDVRSDKQELIDMGILKPFSVKLADSLQLDANLLEQSLATQVSKKYLQQIGILEPYKKNVD